MLNFRKELNEILNGDESIRHQAEFVLKSVLEYFRSKPKEELKKTARVELEFAYDKDKLYVKENSSGKEIFCFMFSDLEAVPKVLCYIEAKLMSEGCKKTSLLPAKDYGGFVVEI